VNPDQTALEIALNKIDAACRLQPCLFLEGLTQIMLCGGISHTMLAGIEPDLRERGGGWKRL
jgi:hypothetical protein